MGDALLLLEGLHGLDIDKLSRVLGREIKWVETTREAAEAKEAKAAGAAAAPATTTRPRVGGWSHDSTERKTCHQ